TADPWERADKKLTTAFWPWSLLAQPEPLPERLVSSAPDAVVDNALGGWGSPANAFGSDVRAAYVEALRDSARVYAICEEYRAAVTLDHEPDFEDRRARRGITSCAVGRPRAGKYLVRRGRRPVGVMAGVGKRCAWRTVRCRSILSRGNSGTNRGGIERLLHGDILRKARAQDTLHGAM